MDLLIHWVVGRVKMFASAKVSRNEFLRVRSQQKSYQCVEVANLAYLKNALPIAVQLHICVFWWCGEVYQNAVSNLEGFRFGQFVVVELVTGPRVLIVVVDRLLANAHFGEVVGCLVRHLDPGAGFSPR